MRLAVILACLVYSLTALDLRGQNSDNILMVGKEDTEKLLDAYYTPFINALGTYNTQNWVNAAWPLKLARFNVSLNTSTSLFPHSFGRYNPATLGLKTFSTSSESAATFLGSKTLAYVSRDTIINGKPQNVQSFKLPDGVRLPVVPYGVPQLNIGIGLGTEISLRGMAFNIDKFKGKYQTWGACIKNDLFHWIKNPKYSLAVYAYIINSSMSLKLNAQPPATIANPKKIDFANQQLKQEFTNQGMGMTISHDDNGVSITGGVSYNEWISKLNLLGNYPVMQIKKDLKGEDYVEVTSFSPKAMVQKVNNVDMFIGATFHGKVGIASLQASYNTLFKYCTINLTLGLGFIQKANKYEKKDKKVGAKQVKRST